MEKIIKDNNEIKTCKCCTEPVVIEINAFYALLENLEGWPWILTNTQILNKDGGVVLDLNQQVIEFFKVHIALEKKFAQSIEKLAYDLHDEKHRSKFYEAQYNRLNEGIGNLSNILKS